MRIVFLLFGVIAYVVFFMTFLALIAFVGGLPVLPRTVDAGGPFTAPGMAAVIDLALIILFAVQHSVMARPGFKTVWTRILPQPIERSFYVLAASAALIVLMVLWRPIPAVVWSLGSPLWAWLSWALFVTGWLIVLVSTFLISHFELFGLKQVWNNLRGKIAAPVVLRQPFFYRLVRHPLYSGFFLAFWATPRMTAGHLLLAAGLSVFMLVAIRFEERDLIGVFGEDYVKYRASTGMLVPRRRRRA
ncbi:membrane protein [Novosphingobium barchaimii LL02]|uniref:methanethiol S-methyltransferase n=1 Tax=Novosphingobium barchaimii LL02 TaxID=1114963 RepID=A0A0J7Y9D0_9SPHN|nr:methanethiol S-methyltransferase [Novosphingobium barchaimii]KMS60222.1 membrane protein [Novosphingobium barchaimii LL02]